MEKTKYRYKCMICGTEVISADDMLSCSACGSDELAKFEITPVIDIVEKKPPKKQSYRRKPAPGLTSDADILSIIKDLDPKPFKDFDPEPSMPASYRPSDPDVLSAPPYRKPSPRVSPPAPPVPPAPPAPPPSLTIWEHIYNFIAKIPWRVLLRIIAPFAIGGGIYGIVKLFI